jgi:hypothetical protein
MNFSRKLVVNYSKTYGAEKDVSEENLSALDKGTWAKVLARLNHLARTEKNYGVIDVLKDWFGKENNEHANELLHRIINAYRDLNIHPSRLLVINIWTNLYLLDRILNVQMNPEQKLSNTDSEKELFDIYLAINDIFGAKTNGIFASVPEQDHPDVIDRIARVYLTNLIPYHDLHHFKATELFVSGTLKAYYLFLFLETNHQDLINLFAAAYGVDNWKDYLKGIMPLFPSNDGDGSGLHYFSLKDSADKEKSRVFLNHLALADEYTYAVKTDFLNARSNPLFKIDEETYLIMDTVLVVNRIYNSVFFELLRLAEKNKKLHAAYKDFFSFYTYEFIEQYLSYTLLRKIFGKTRYYQISGKEIVERYHIDTEPDYYVRNGNKVFLFEVKGSMLTGEAKQSFDFPTVEKELRAKFLYNEADDENKAIAQLAERARILFSGDAVYDEHYEAHKIRIYPILIVSELALTTPGINVIFNQWFQEELEKFEILRDNRKRVADLVIIDLDTLVLYSQQFAQHPGLFEESLVAYYSAVDRKKIKPKHGVPPTPEYMESLMVRSYQPYNGFMFDFRKLTTPDIFREFGENLLK